MPKITIPSSYNSTEVWFELGNHSGEDVVLYVPKVRDNAFWSPDNIQPDRPSFVERYQQREFGFEVTPSFPRDDGSRDLLLVFLAADTVEGHLLQGLPVARITKRASNSRSVDNRRGAMFVPVPEVVQDVEQFYVAPSVVRLYGRYPVTDRLGEFAYLRSVMFEKRGFGGVEFQSKVVVRLDSLPDAPDQIVEGRSEIVHNVPDRESDRWRRLAMQVQHIREVGILPFTLHASDHFTWFGRKEVVNQYFQAIDAHTCPVKPQLGKMHVIVPRISSAIQGVHMLYSKPEGKQDEHTKDTHRSRNPRANKRSIPKVFLNMLHILLA